MRKLSGNISSFITLKEQSQQSSEKINSAYSNQSCIPPIDAIKIYIRATDKLIDNVNAIITITDKITHQANNANLIDKENKITMLKQELAESYFKTCTILEEFIKGFSVSHDKVATKLISLLYYGFNSVQDNLSLGYITNKTSYYQNCLQKIGNIKNLFNQMFSAIQSQHDKKCEFNTTDNSPPASSDIDV